VVAHALHNAGASLGSVTLLGPLFSIAWDWMGILVVFVIILLATVQERRWIEKYLADEVTTGLITPRQYRAACSYLERVGARVEALFRGDLGLYFRLGKFYQKMTLLAFRKYQLASFGDEAAPGGAGGNRAEVDRQRREIAMMQGRI